jgi:hypothetical protein
MTDQKEPSVWKRLWDFIGDIGKIRTILALTGASGAVTAVTSRLPGGWHLPQYWAVAAFTFFGTGLVFLVIYAVVDAGKKRFVRWRNPPTLAVNVCGGCAAKIELRHTGVPATYSAEARIKAVMDDAVNPSPTTFQCLIVGKDGRSYRQVLLADKDFAHIELARIETNEFSGNSRLVIVRPGSTPNIGLPRPSALLAVEIRADDGREVQLDVVVGSENGSIRAERI